MKSVVAAFALALSLAGACQAAPASPLGRWISATGNVEVTIHPCGRALCGQVSKVLGNRSMHSLAASKAPPASVGLTIFSGVRSAGDGRWVGHIYDRERRRTYDCELSLSGPDALVVHPYILLPIFGQTQVWKRSGG